MCHMFGFMSIESELHRIVKKSVAMFELSQIYRSCKLLFAVDRMAFWRYSWIKVLQSNIYYKCTHILFIVFIFCILCLFVLTIRMYVLLMALKAETYSKRCDASAQLWPSTEFVTSQTLQYNLVLEYVRL